MHAIMPDWIHNTHACYVLAAYAVAAVALIGLAGVSVCAYRKRLKEWRVLSEQSGNDLQ